MGAVAVQLRTVFKFFFFVRIKDDVLYHSDSLKCFGLLIVPAGVRNLSLADSSTEDLLVTWLSAPGDVDHYEVQLLYNDMKVFPPITLTSTTNRYLLSSLTPGRLYKIVVSTFSGPNLSVQLIKGRTGTWISGSNHHFHTKKQRFSVMFVFFILQFPVK